MSETIKTSRNSVIPLPQALLHKLHISYIVINPFNADPVTALYFAILVKPTTFNFWHSGALALSPERQSARMSQIKNGGLDQYGAERFEQQQFETAGVEGVKLWHEHRNVIVL